MTRKHGPDGHNRMGDAVEAINFYQEIGARSGLSPTDRTMADAILIGWGWHPKQADAILEKAADRGYIEYGVSARTGWLTDKGRALLHSVEPAPPSKQGSAS